MQHCPNLLSLRQWRAAQHGKLALVPTMGALHAGHMALVEQAKAQADHVVVSIFVNPTQFGAGEDFEAYPRTFEQDAALCEQAGVDAIFSPAITDIYQEPRTHVHVAGISDKLCGQSRPGHFDGVATIVSILFHLVQPHIACFGEKDYQQCCVIKQMVRDLHMPIEIMAVPTLREDDGLAMSSRNRYLTKEERAIAPQIYEDLQQLSQDIIAGAVPMVQIKKLEEKWLLRGFSKIDYIRFCDAATLEPLGSFDGRPARLLAAAHLGKARLIDNIAVG